MDSTTRRASLRAALGVAAAASAVPAARSPQRPVDDSAASYPDRSDQPIKPRHGRADQPAYDVARDLAPIAVLATFPTFLLVAPESPFRTLEELVAWEKNSPGRGTYGFGGLVFQMLVEQINLRAGTRFQPSSTAAASTPSTRSPAATWPWPSPIPARR